MKKIFGCIIILFLGYQGSSQKSVDFPIKFRVATFNVGHFNQGLKGGLELKGGSVSEEAKKKYAKLEMLSWRNWIGKQALDFFAINEWNRNFDVDSNFNAEDELLKPFYNNIYFGNEHTWIYNGIATNYRLTNIRQKYLAGDYYALIGDLKIGKKTITFISTHIPWQSKWHSLALDSMLVEMKKYEYLICMGDMNSTDSEQLRFQEEGFNIANGGNQGWFPTGMSGLRLQGMNDGPDHHIDNIITSKNIKIMNVSAPHTGLNDYDHLPVIADIIITDK